MAKKKRKSNKLTKIAESSITSKMIYLIVTLIFFIASNMYLTDLLLDEMDLGLTVVNPVFSLRYVENTGAAFSLLENYPYAVIALSAAALIVVLVYTINNLQTLSMKAVFCSSLLMSGIFCNLYERIFFGYVRDFIHLNFVDFPIFNFSDMSINIAVLFIIVLLFSKNILKNI
ncbi:signal peptidase II [bacterium]|nr:signal peptidase II [bacterium]